jgi:hypothetical protein
MTPDNRIGQLQAGSFLNEPESVPQLPRIRLPAGPGSIQAK